MAARRNCKCASFFVLLYRLHICETVHNLSIQPFKNLCRPLALHGDYPVNVVMDDRELLRHYVEKPLRIGAALPSAILDEPERVTVRIVHVKLTRAPTLINRTFMDFFRSVRISRRVKPSLPELAEDSVNVVGGDNNDLTKFPVARVAGEEESIAVARQRAEGRVGEIVIAFHALEIEYAGVERQRGFHVSTAD